MLLTPPLSSIQHLTKRVKDRAIENKRLNGQTSSLFLKKKGLETRSKGVSFLGFEAIIFMGSIVKTFMILITLKFYNILFSISSVHKEHKVLQVQHH